MAGIFDTKKEGGVFGSSPRDSGIFKTTSTDGGVFAKRSTSGNSLDINQVENLELLGKQEGFRESKVFNALEKLGRTLNVDIAAIAGGVRGAIDKDETIGEGIQRGLKENIGFSDVIREVLGTPDTRAGKVAVGTAGFVGDVLFSPITYLTFGVGGVGKTAAKVGAKALTKRASKQYNKASREILDQGFDRAKKFVAEGVDPVRAERLANSEGKRIINELGQKIFSKEGLTVKNADRLIEAGMNVNTAQAFQNIGGELLDRGGIKFMGKTLVGSERLKNTLVGKAARRIGEQEVVVALKNTLGRTFSFNYGKNAEVAEILEKGGILSRRATKAISDSTDEMFKNLPEEKQITLFKKVFKEREKVVEKADQLVKKRISEYNEQFPIKAFKNKITAERKLAKLAKAGISTSIEKDEATALKAILRSRQDAKALMRESKLLFKDKEIQKVSNILFEGENSVVAKMAKASGISEADAFKFYLPSKFKDKVKIKEFTFARNLSSPELGFLKEFNAVANDELITSASEALKRGRIQVTTARIKSDSIRALFRGDLGVGKPISAFANESQAKAAGYVKFQKELVGGKTEGWLPKEIAEEVTDFVDPKASHIDDLAKASGFDWATGIFKGYVTSMFPAFHFRNMTSNQFQLMMKFGVDGANPINHKLAAKLLRGKNLDAVVTSVNGSKITLKNLLKEINKNSDFLDKGAFSNMEQLLEGVKQGSSLNPLSRRFVGLEKGRELGTFIESYHKLVGVISSVRAGNHVDKAIKEAEQALFNYRKLTPFEKDIMRRVIPFYTWAKKNLEFQVKTLATAPGRTAAQLKFVKGIGESVGEPMTDDDKDGLPSWVVDSLGIKMGTRDVGGSKVFTGLGLPVEEFITRFSGEKGFVWNAIKNTTTQANPLIKFPIERSTGVDMFQGRPITEISNAQSIKPFIDVLPKPVADEFKALLKWKEVTKPRFVNGVQIGTVQTVTANPFALHLFRNLPTARLQQTIGLTEDTQRENWDKLLQVMTGIRGWSIDKERQAYFDDLEKKKELVRFLKRAGIIGEKQILFEK